MNIFGNFNKKNNTWGSALKLKMFFEAVGIKDHRIQRRLVNP